MAAGGAIIPLSSTRVRELGVRGVEELERQRVALDAFVGVARAANVLRPPRHPREHRYSAECDALRVALERGVRGVGVVARAQGRALSLGGAIQRKRRQPPDPEPEVENGMED